MNQPTNPQQPPVSLVHTNPKQGATDSAAAKAKSRFGDRKLILTLEGEVIREYPVGNKSISIGRKHGNDIQLNDLTTSGRHALITSIPDYVFIEDLDSTNGTLVNGNHIKKVALEHGDIIQIGHHQFTYLNQTEAKYEPTMFVKAEFDETQIIYPEWEAGHSGIKGQPLGGLRTINGPVSKSVMELRKAYNTIGFQGKRMALITRGTKGYTIAAVVSTRSRRAADIPLVNGIPLSSEPKMLKENDIINIAGFEVEFYIIR
jgi:hypothetical protein